MIRLEHLYILAGLVFAAVAIKSARDATNARRASTAAFWGFLAISFLFGSLIGDLANGAIALCMTGLAARGLGQGRPSTTSSEERLASAQHRGNRLFLPALVIPAIALAGTLAVQNTPWGAGLIEAKNATLISLVLGVLIAVSVIIAWLKPPLTAPIEECRRLLDAVGWAAILPQMLASLGAVFLTAGVGAQVGKLFSDFIPLPTPISAVAAYCIGMAGFTLLMGNAFAAFPVMTAAVGLPVVVTQYGGDPAVVCAIGMLAGFCGTLMTPMAANFNVVPANLLDLPDRKAAINGVIRAQLPTALAVLVANIILMQALAFHR